MQQARMLREKEVIALLGVGRTTLWRMCKDGRFPEATHLSSRLKVWHSKDVEDALERIRVGNW
tara:strand:- start:899 stop:1087 length:189 start_codon:yes stop_codon:yes gene_type:complete